MAELLLSAFLDVLLDRLLSPDFLKFAHREGLRKQLDKWGKTLTRIRKVLDDAEDKQHTERLVKAWLEDLRDLAYDVEDILDEVATEAALRRKLMAGESQASSSKKLEIFECALLEERCKKDQKGEWRKIADIPCVLINGKDLYEIETEE